MRSERGKGTAVLTIGYQGRSIEWDPPSQSLRRGGLYMTYGTYMMDVALQDNDLRLEPKT